jgi:hypothetical protein
MTEIARTGPSVRAAGKEAATRAENERRIVEMERKRLRMEEAEKEAAAGWPSRTTTGRVGFPSPLFRTNAASSDCESLAHEALPAPA